MRQSIPAIKEIDEMSTIELIELFNSEDKKVAIAVEASIGSIVKAVEAVAEALAAGGRMIYIGSGTAGKIGVMDASECPPTFGVADDLISAVISGGAPAVAGWCEDTEDNESMAVRDIAAKGVSAQDVVVGISASGSTPYVLAAVKFAREQRAKTIGVCCFPQGELAAVVDIPIIVDVGPEVIQGSTRLKAGTAQKMVINMFSSCAMIKLGKTYGSLMVNVKPINAKLKQRVLDIIQDAAGCSAESARQALAQTDGNTKAAILMLLTGLEPAEAIELIEKHKGYLKKAIKDDQLESHL
ncbi:N-acetylmuramic acid 6-phosphate etherase [Sporomusa malonica]|uniref:N-acetylmuramic acid 6-phosphate etherase n=1 Tax=Sporomusa malonica TaxID=112901 RepID=A0A1W1ZRE1_9FIRM|nr:N-acetylmuramic acid 6-phosphate etherase [Sporomusa malonica]SMC50863.1 N-acetylmuramic acid 6-phosphate etherase [Sporomusa malonica]